MTDTARLAAMTLRAAIDFFFMLFLSLGVPVCCRMRPGRWNGVDAEVGGAPTEHQCFSSDRARGCFSCGREPIRWLSQRASVDSRESRTAAIWVGWWPATSVHLQ